MANILIVDDEPGVVITLKTMLMAECHTTLIAENGVKGLEVLKENVDTCDLIITDIQMPEMDGLQFISHVLDIKADLPIIAISGGGNKIATVDPLDSLKDQINGIIRKPFTHDELFMVVDSVLEKSTDGE